MDLPPVDLPEDIMREILTKVPATTLMRCSCVCKLWRDLVIKIKNPYFGYRHLDNLNKYCNNHQTVVFFRGFHKNSSPEDSLLTRNVLPLLSPHDDHPHLKVIGACNGIVCLAPKKGWTSDVVHLYNPITREDLKLPPSPFSTDDVYFIGAKYSFYEQKLGFGFDASCNDYKVIRFKTRREINKLCTECVRVEIYRLSTRCWSKLHNFHIEFDYGGGGVFVNGFFHWPMMRFGDTRCMITFSFRTEKFGEIEYPHQSCGWELTELNDSLAVWCHNKDDTKVEVWVMGEHGKKESWNKNYSVDFAVPIRTVLSIWGRKDMSLEVLGVLEWDKQKVAALLTEGGECSTLFGFDLGFSCSWVVFRPSLVSLLQR